MILFSFSGHYLIRRISYYGVEFHVFFECIVFPIIDAAADFGDEQLRLVCDFIDEVFKVSCIDLYLTEATQSALGDTFAISVLQTMKMLSRSTLSHISFWMDTGISVASI